ncbi:MAG: outer membrane lipoprotein carrier protein LolA [Cytophagales bacterium]|nr:MAG: outer membrane lipoprotein carrier protein LolA [Cytophagales bacterium]
MRKYILFSLLMYFSVGFLFAQQDPKAKAILDAISQRYKGLGAFKVFFNYTLNNKSAGVSDKVSGEVAVKDDKYLLKVKGQEIYCNGKTLWTYLKDDNEVNISDYEPEPGEVTPTNIYTIYQTGYKYVFVGETTEAGEVFENIELTPNNANARYFKIKIKSNKATKSIKTWEIYEKNGNVYTYAIYQLNQLSFPSTTAVDSYFSFDKTKYPNVRVVDLR